MGVFDERFRLGDVYIDFPYEKVMFRFNKQTGKVYQKFYGKQEVEVPHSSNLFAEARIGGNEISSDDYTKN